MPDYQLFGGPADGMTGVAAACYPRIDVPITDEAAFIKPPEGPAFSAVDRVAIYLMDEKAAMLHGFPLRYRYTRTMKG